MGPILIAEPNIEHGQSLRFVLEMAGYEVRWVTDGMDAYNEIVARGFSLLISALFIPGLQGVDLLRRLRMEDFQLPAVFMSEPVDQNLLSALNSLGAGYLAKPLSKSELLDRVSKILNNKE